jgi:enoyl-CoA hydratase
MHYENLLLETGNGRQLITINRPDKMNALNRATLQELDQAMTQAAQDKSVRVILITGAGDKAFVAGADISELAQLNPLQARQAAMFGQNVFRRIETMNKPVIAMVNGFALGGGCELAMACHLRLAAPHARFGQPEVALGLIPGYGGTQRLARLIGKGRAMELCITGALIDAQEAHRLGLVNRLIASYQKDDAGEIRRDKKGRPIFDRNPFLAAGDQLASEIASKAPLAVAWCLEAIDRGLEMDLDAGQRLEQDLFGYCFGTEDMKEGTTAFMEKRAAEFKGE